MGGLDYRKGDLNIGEQINPDKVHEHVALRLELCIQDGLSSIEQRQQFSASLKLKERTNMPLRDDERVPG